jgi:chromosome segregation ATPase
MTNEELSRRLEAAWSAIEAAEGNLDQAEREISARRAELKDAERCRDNAKREIAEQRQQAEILQLALIGIETQPR